MIGLHLAVGIHVADRKSRVLVDPYWIDVPDQNRFSPYDGIYRMLETLSTLDSDSSFLPSILTTRTRLYL
jgi:hypothetical protein